MLRTSWRNYAMLCALLVLVIVSVDAHGNGPQGSGKSLFPEPPKKAWELPNHPKGAVASNFKDLFTAAMPGIPRQTTGAVIETMGVKTEADSWLHRNMHPSVVPPQPKAPEPLIYRTVHAVVGEGLTADAAGVVPVPAQKHMLMDIPDPAHPSSEPPSWRILSNPDIPMPPLPAMAPQPPQPPKAPAGIKKAGKKGKGKGKKGSKKGAKKGAKKGSKKSFIEQDAEHEQDMDEEADGNGNKSKKMSKAAALKMEILQQQKLQQQLLRDQALEIQRLRNYIAYPVGQAPMRTVSTYFSGRRSPNAIYTFATQQPYAALYPHETLPNLLPIMPDQNEAMHRANLADTVYADSMLAARTLPFGPYRDLVNLHNSDGMFQPAVPAETQPTMPSPGWTEYSGKVMGKFKAPTVEQALAARNNYEKAVEKWYQDAEKARQRAVKRHGEGAKLIPKPSKRRKGKKFVPEASEAQEGAEASFVESEADPAPVAPATKPTGSTADLANAAATAANTATTVPPVKQVENKAKKDQKAKKDKKNKDKKDKKDKKNKKDTKKDKKDAKDKKSKKSPPTAKAPAMRPAPAELATNTASQKSFVEVSSDTEGESEAESEGENESASQPAMDLEDMIAPTSQLPRPVAASLLEAAHASNMAAYFGNQNKAGHATSTIAKRAEQALIRNSLRLMRMRSADEFDAQNGFSDSTTPSLAETAVMLKDRTLIPTTPSSTYRHGMPYGLPKPVGVRQAPFKPNTHEATQAEIQASRSSLLALDSGRVRAVGAEEAFLGNSALTKTDQALQEQVAFQLPSEWLKRPNKQPLPKVVPPPKLEVNRTPMYGVDHALI